MKKYLFGLLLAMLMGFGIALELPNGSTVSVTNDAGVVVGLGAFADGTLELDIAEDASGFLTLTFTTADGEVVSVEVMVSADGEVLVVDTMTELGGEVASAGGTSEISFVSSAEIAAEVEELEAVEGEGGVDGLTVASEMSLVGAENSAAGLLIASDARDRRGAPEGSEDTDDVEQSEEAESDEATEVEDEETEVEDESSEVEGEADANADVAVGFIPTAPGAP